jgi:hypothetical protein
MNVDLALSRQEFQPAPQPSTTQGARRPAMAPPMRLPRQPARETNQEAPISPWLTVRSSGPGTRWLAGWGTVDNRE